MRLEKRSEAKGEETYILLRMFSLYVEVLWRPLADVTQDATQHATRVALD